MSDDDATRTCRYTKFSYTELGTVVLALLVQVN